MHLWFFFSFSHAIFIQQQIYYQKKLVSTISTAFPGNKELVHLCFSNSHLFSISLFKSDFSLRFEKTLFFKAVMFKWISSDSIRPLISKPTSWLKLWSASACHSVEQLFTVTCRVWDAAVQRTKSHQAECAVGSWLRNDSDWSLLRKRGNWSYCSWKMCLGISSWPQKGWRCIYLTVCSSVYHRQSLIQHLVRRRVSAATPLLHH